MGIRWAALVLLAALAGPAAAGPAVLYVATGGDDGVGDGSAGNPFATIDRALQDAVDGSTILVAPGTYTGRVRLDQQFALPVTIRSQVPYQARLRRDGGAVITAFTGTRIVVEGFDIAHDPANTGPLVIQVQDLLGDVAGSAGGTDPVVSGIVFRDNIIHGSTDNDLLKINNGAEDVLVEGNLFYDQAGSDEHMDVNSVVGVTIQDNVFFNTTDTGTSSFIVVKDSNGSDDTVLGSRDITVRRNVFLNWQGSDGQGFLRFGEDGTANFEARELLVENNLMIGNSSDLMRSPLTVMGSRDLVFRNNTLTGDLPSRSFAGRLFAFGQNPASDNLAFFNNVYSDPTGTLGSEALLDADLFESPPGQVGSTALDNNLYYNGGSAIPDDPTQALRFSDDANAVVGDPGLADPAGLVLPTWNGAGFADGSATIREVFESLVDQFGRPGVGSPALDAADPATAAVEDILGRERGPAPDVGAFELDPFADSVFSDGFESP